MMNNSLQTALGCRSIEFELGDNPTLEQQIEARDLLIERLMLEKDVGFEMWEEREKDLATADFLINMYQQSLRIVIRAVIERDREQRIKHCGKVEMGQ